MFKKLNSVLPLSALSLLMVANSYAGNSERIDALEARVANLTQDNTQRTVGGKNPTTRDAAYGSGAYIVADFLYWQATQDGIEYALSSHSPLGLASFLGSGEAEITHGKMKDIDFDWGPGFRIGLGYNFNYDQWDLSLSWTRFHNDSSSSSHAPAGGSLAALWIPTTVGGGDTQHASAHWRLGYDVVDLELGRSFYLSKALSARPFVGLRAALIDQHVRFHYEDVHLLADPNLFDMNTRVKNAYIAGGLRAGTDLNFRVNQHWSFFGAGSASLVYGEFDVKLGFQFPGQDLGPFKLGYKSHFYRTQANVEGAIGLQWETGYSHGRYHLTILACYEFVQWFNQNQLLKVLAPALFTPAFLSNDGDLGLQGGTVSARFDF